MFFFYLFIKKIVITGPPYIGIRNYPIISLMVCRYFGLSSFFLDILEEERPGPCIGILIDIGATNMYTKEFN